MATLGENDWLHKDGSHTDCLISAYLGNQQFTTSHLVFVNCNTALQIHWDWAWTMQDVVVESCGTGVIIVGGVSDTPIVKLTNAMHSES